VSVSAPLRLLAAAAAALLIATLIGSSSAHAILLGDAVVRSTPGAPLRVVIPLKPMPGEALEAACFRLLPIGDPPSPMVTAKVILERGAATPRLIVTTQDPVADPLVRFAIEARCDGVMRRNYALQLDLSGVTAAAIDATTRMNSAREPGQERLETAQIPAIPAVDKASLEPAHVARAANGQAGDAERYIAAARSGRIPTVLPNNANPVAAANNDTERLVWYLGAPLGMGALALAIVFMTRRRLPAGMPDWTRGGELSAPRSRTDMSAQPVRLGHDDDFTPMPRLATTQRPDGASLRVMKPGIAANTLRPGHTEDISTLDTLINDIAEADRQEERAVRDAWAAARNAVEGEDNEILRAIDEAERALLFVPPPAEQAQTRSLDDDLLSTPQRPDKAAA
jgi:hypothetical protein